MKDSILADRYFVSGEIGSGGMARVYRGYDKITSTEVAIKHFPKAIDVSRIEMASFEKELASLQRMQHPNVIRLLNHGHDSEGMPYLVLELMDSDLVRLRDSGKSSAFDGYDDFFDQLGYPLLCALEYAHGLHITHRDVKPRNILISKEGVVKLADFGIARLKGHLSGTKTLRDFELRPFGPPEVDDGAFSHSRDVFSFGAVTVWALSDGAITDYSQLYEAADSVDAHPSIKRILQKCLSRSPNERFENAIILKCEIDNVLRQRKSAQQGQRRQVARIKLTEKARSLTQEMLGISPSEVERLLTEDIGDSPTISEWTFNGKKVQNEFAVVGAQYQYHIFFKQNGEPFFLLGIDSPSVSVIQHRKKYQAELPFDFSFKALGAFIESIEALDIIEAAIRNKVQDTAGEAEHPLIKTWSTILSAKREIEHQRTPAVPYSNLRIRDGYVFAVVSNTTSLEPGTRWTAKSGKYTVALEVSHLNGNEVIFYWRSSSEQFQLPVKGEFNFDIIATETCLDRQEDSLERLGRRQTANSQLLEILADPEKVQAPEQLSYKIQFPQGQLDQSKQEAICAALSCKDMLLVHGPPGTGKTKLIAFLIDSISRFETPQSSSSSILLVSQTHVAIDNALEKVAEINPSLKMLRISSTGEVAKSVEEYLYEEQAFQWKTQVQEQSERWIEKFAKDNEVNPTDVFKGCKILELAGIVHELDGIERDAKAISSEIESRQLDSTDNRDAQEDIRISQEKLRSLNARKRSLTKDRQSLYTEVSDTVGEPIEVVANWSAQDLRSLAEDFLGGTPAHKKVKSLIEIRADWILRFGRDRSFDSAICERSDVVAGTCIGFMGLRDIDQVEFDWCIVDEASKATVLDTLVPMVRAKKWVLVGDSKQLPPFNEFSSQFAEICAKLGVNKDELSQSLFTQLESSLPEKNQHVLRHQYRMCRPIARLVADCFYPNQLEPGDREPDDKTQSCFGQPIVWLDTSGFPNRFERPYGNSYTNECEIEMIVANLKQLFKTWDFQSRNEKILLLSPYTAQVSALWKAVSSRFNDLECSFVESSTIDAVQGRQAKAVFLSLTRNEPNSFVDDAHRVNVAISRAKDLLVIVGNEKSVRESHSCENLTKVLKYFDRTVADCRVIRHLFGNPVR